jgi:hypothetical protein
MLSPRKSWRCDKMGFEVYGVVTVHHPSHLNDQCLVYAGRKKENIRGRITLTIDRNSSISSRIRRSPDNACLIVSVIWEVDSRL